MKELEGLHQQQVKIYISNDVHNELAEKRTKNFGSFDKLKKEQAFHLFHQVNIALYNIANFIMLDKTNLIDENDYYYDIQPSNGVVLGTILFSAFINDSNEFSFLITKIVWKYSILPQWNIVDNKTSKTILENSFIDNIVREVINEMIYSKNSLLN